MFKYLKPLGMALLTTVYASQSFADSNKPMEFTMAINLYGYTLLYEPPSWIAQELLSRKPGLTYRFEDASSFIFEQIPSDESFDSWSVMHTIAAMRVSVPKKEYQNVLRQSTYQEACQAGLMKSKVIALSRHEVVVVEGCGRFMMDDKPRGEISVQYRALLSLKSKAYIKRSLTWLAPGGFDVDDVSTYPVTLQEISKAKDLLRRSRIL